GLTYASSSTSAAHDYIGLNAGNYTFYARIIDKDDAYTDYPQMLTIQQADSLGRITPYSGIYDGAAHNLSGTVTGVTGDPSALGSSLTFGTGFTNPDSYVGPWGFEGGEDHLDEGGTRA